MADERYTHLHKESKHYLQIVNKSPKKMHELSIAEARQMSLSASEHFAGNFDFDGSRHELIIDPTDNTASIPVWVYTPTQLPDNPVIMVYYHGGGWTVGCRQTHDETCKILSSHAKCIVVNVEYRLGPENKYPACQDDAIASARWALENKVLLGGTLQSKLGVAGDSAGGNLAAIVGHDVPCIDFQILVYPSLNLNRKVPTQSQIDYGDGFLLTTEISKWFGKQFLSKAKDAGDPRLSCLLREKFDNVPPTLFIVAECDPLRDDSYEYDHKLRAAGVYTDFLLMKGTIHAFFSLPGLFKESCKTAYDKVVDFLMNIASRNGKSAASNL